MEQNKKRIYNTMENTNKTMQKLHNKELVELTENDIK